MLIYLPAGYRPGVAWPLVVALHGWGQKPEDWREQTAIARLADQAGVVLALPAMGRTVYETRFYPETVLRWNRVSGLAWITSVVVPAIRARYSVSDQPSKVAVIGVSMGGRGAVRLCATSGLFGFCAGLSGTYDLSLLPKGDFEYRIHAQVFGARDRFPERWHDEDCAHPAHLRALSLVPIYLVHGDQDRQVDISQLRSFRSLLADAHPNASLIEVPHGAHGWEFWSSELPGVFEHLRASR
jgi:S-formylglutathione hydrolase FrmB